MSASPSQPRFSVVIATHNRRAYVREAIRSVLGQTYPAHEVIVVVDGSTDDTLADVRRDFPLAIVYEQPNLGPSVARNTGVAIATGDWVCFLDDDDIWHRDKLRDCAEFIQSHPNCLALRHLIWFFSDSEGGPRGGYGFVRDFVATTVEECHAAVADGAVSQNNLNCLFLKGDSFRRLLERNVGSLSASVVDRATLIRAGCFCPMQTCGDDWTMFLNVARLTEWETIPRRLGFSRLHPFQNTGDPRNGLYTIAGQVNAWYSGRPMQGKCTSGEQLNELIGYGRAYRQAVQTSFWEAIRRGEFRLALLIRRMGRLLLPRLGDYVYAMVPPQVTWRWEHYILRRHADTVKKLYENPKEFQESAEQSGLQMGFRTASKPVKQGTAIAESCAGKTG